MSAVLARLCVRRRAAGLAGGNITQSAIDESVTRILTGMFRYYCVVLYQHVAAEQQVL